MPRGYRTRIVQLCSPGGANTCHHLVRFISSHIHRRIEYSVLGHGCFWLALLFPVKFNMALIAALMFRVVSGALKMREWKMQEWKIRERNFARIAFSTPAFSVPSLYISHHSQVISHSVTAGRQALAPSSSRHCSSLCESAVSPLRCISVYSLDVLMSRADTGHHRHKMLSPVTSPFNGHPACTRSRDGSVAIWWVSWAVPGWWQESSCPRALALAPSCSPQSR